MPSAKERLYSDALKRRRESSTSDQRRGLGRIQHLSRPEGNAPCVVLVHPVGGSLFCYQALASKMGSSWRVVGIEGVVPPSRVTITLQDRARDYSAQLKAEGVKPDLLAGWSVGGLIAWEMAHQFDDMPVLMIDSTWPQERDPKPGDAELREWFRSDLLAGSTHDTIGPGDDETEMLDYYFEVFRSNALAFVSHEPTLNSGTAGIVAGVDTDPHLWIKAGKGNPTIWLRPEGHYDLLRSADAIEEIDKSAAQLLERTC